METVEAALAELKRGGMVLVVDDEDRENEGDLVMAADMATPEAIGFMIRHTSGVLCVGIEEDRADELELPLMVTAFTVSVDVGDVGQSADPKPDDTVLVRVHSECLTGDVFASHRCATAASNSAQRCSASPRHAEVSSSTCVAGRVAESA